MDNRLGAVLVLVIIIAVGLGLIFANQQPRTIAAPRPTVLPTPIPKPKSNEVDIIQFRSDPTQAHFNPQRLVTHVGQTVTWVNKTGNAQAVTANNGAFDSGVIQPAGTFSWKPTSAGTFNYSSYITGQLGTIVVKP
ncbi:MAG TPA: hypothetical protein VFA78_06335 [Chloroflexota bacterium]|nr:hypothetical protein [Chloroflexota bacterium]